MRLLLTKQIGSWKSIFTHTTSIYYICTNDKQFEYGINYIHTHTSNLKYLA